MRFEVMPLSVRFLRLGDTLLRVRFLRLGDTLLREINPCGVEKYRVGIGSNSKPIIVLVSWFFTSKNGIRG
jgi:hypothetical protein